MKQRSAESLATQQLRNEKGASMVEYALLAALIAVGAIGSLSTLGDKGRSTFMTVKDSMASAGIPVIGSGGGGSGTPPPPPVF